MNDVNLGRLMEAVSARVLSPSEQAREIDSRVKRLDEMRPVESSGVFIYQQNCIDFFLSLLACWRRGLCVIPIDPATPPELRRRLETKYAPIVIIHEDGRWENRAGRFRWPQGARLLLMTSGSTGTPKGVLHTEAGIKHKLAALRRHIPESETAVSLCALPTHFGHGLMCNSLFPWLSGQDLVIAPSFSPATCGRVDDWICNYHVTFMSSTPVTWNFLDEFSTARKKPSLRRIHCASAPLKARHVEWMRKWSGDAELWNVYGLTEFLGWIAGSRIQQDASSSFAGAPWDTEVKAEEGRLRLRAPFQTIAVVNEEIQTVPEASWIDTGDLGEFRDGQIVLGSRADFLINKGGLKIDPAGIETIVASHPMVRESFCFGFADRLWGEKAALAVVAQPGNEIAAPALLQWMAERLPAPQLPDRIFLLKDLPRNNRGKVDREELKRRMKS